MIKITEEQYQLAQSRVEELLPLVDDTTPLSDPKAVELMMMSDIIIDYEKEHHALVDSKQEKTLHRKKRGNELTGRKSAVTIRLSRVRKTAFLRCKNGTFGEQERYFWYTKN